MQARKNLEALETAQDGEEIDPDLPTTQTIPGNDSDQDTDRPSKKAKTTSSTMSLPSTEVQRGQIYPNIGLSMADENSIVTADAAQESTGDEATFRNISDEVNTSEPHVDIVQDFQADEDGDLDCL